MNCSTISLQTFPLADWTLAHEARLVQSFISEIILFCFLPGDVNTLIGPTQVD